MRAVTEMQERRRKILSALEEYVDLGLPVIPLCAHDHIGYSERHISRCNQAGKIPLIKGWQTHETTSQAQVREWVREFKNINIGLPLGHVSGYVGIDVDGALGEDMLVDMSSGDLPETWEYVTGAGRRLLYTIPVGMMTKKHVNTGEGDHQECSILAYGQQTVLPPSIHHSGRLYEWIDGRSPEDLDCAMAPTWLLNLVRQDNKQSPGTINLTSMKPSYIPPTEEDQTIEVGPILITDDTLPIEFIDYEDLSMDMTKPDTSYVGKEAKMQDKEESGPELLEMVVSAGGRDNHMTKVIGYLCAKNRNLGREGIMLLAKSINITKIQPPLDDMAIESKVNHFWETEEMKSAQYKNLSASDDKKSFEAGTIAQVTLNILEEKGYVLKADPDQAIIWITKKEEGPWKYCDVSGQSSPFHEHIIAPLTDPKYGGESKWWSRKNFAEVANALVMLLRTQGRKWEVDSRNARTQDMKSSKYIPLETGKLLDWETGELKPWDPETHITYTLPIQYDPAATCPNWQARLAEWLPDEGSRAIIQEFIGYSLVPYMGFEKALMLLGEGANGKSILLETIQGMLGYEAVGSSSMSNLFGRFGQIALFGKILNISNEAGADYLKGPNADAFKEMVSGTRIVADVKNKDAVVFNNTAKFIFATNHLVKTSDKSEGWRRRTIIIPFDQDFSKSNIPKYEIMEPLQNEYAGIFNWAIQGLQRLIKQQRFSVSETVINKMMKVAHANDVTVDFFDHCLELTPSLSANGEAISKGTPTTIVHDLFVQWCMYRENNTQKTKTVIAEFLEQKRKISKGRMQKRDMFMGTQAKTMCWVNLRVNIKDDEFIDFLDESLEIANGTPIKEYVIRRKMELENPVTVRVSEIPSSQVK